MAVRLNPYIAFSDGRARAMAQLAGLAEAIVPERNLAMSLYVAAYTLQPDPEWMANARRLSQQLGDFPRQAALAELEYQETRDASDV